MTVKQAMLSLILFDASLVVGYHFFEKAGLVFVLLLSFIIYLSKIFYDHREDLLPINVWDVIKNIVMLIAFLSFMVALFIILRNENI